MDLKGATVVVTGGARRVGRHVATRLAERGANIVVNYRTSAKEARGAVEDFTALGVGALAVQADVSTQAGVERIRDAAIERFGGVDVLLNNASIYAETPLDDLTEADFDRNIAVNLKGPYLGCWLFGLHMRERGRGKIVNIADWAVNRPYVNYAPYFVAKGGIVTLTRVFAKELAPTVMVNAIAPGPILMPADFSQDTIDAVARRHPARAHRPPRRHCPYRALPCGRHRLCHRCRHPRRRRPYGLLTGATRAMYEIVKHIDFCFGHRLIDYQGKCNQPHGHNGRVEIRLASDTLDEMGMVADFRDVRRSMQAWIDENLDHRMILRRDDPLAEAIQALGQHAYLIDDNPTTENLARLVCEQAQALGFPVIAVTLWETPDSYATYAPTPASVDVNGQVVGEVAAARS